jgi:outer membrane protein assembly factor BamB
MLTASRLTCMLSRFVPVVTLGILLGLAGCREAPPGSPRSTLPPAAVPTTEEGATSFKPAVEQRPRTTPTIEAFPRATTTVAEGQALLWAPWPMEGRDPQRTNRGSVSGPRSGRLLWTVDIERPSFSQVVQARDGTIYVGTETGKLLAVRPGAGVIWSFTATPPVPTPAIGPDGTVYLRGGDGSLYALHSDGRRRWTTDIGAEPKLLGPSPLIGPDSYGYLTSYHQGLVYLVQPGGFFHWAVNTRARTLAGPAVGPDGTVYAGAADGSLRAIDPEGVELWRTDVAGPITGPPAVGPSGQVYALVGDKASELVSLGSEGAVNWRAANCWGDGAPVMWAAVATDGRVHLGPCAIGPTGGQVWRAAIQGSAVSPSALDISGHSFVAAGNSMYAIDRDGHIIWSVALESSSLTPPIIGADGTLLLAGSEPDRLYAIGGG